MIPSSCDRCSFSLRTSTALVKKKRRKELKIDHFKQISPNSTCYNHSCITHTYFCHKLVMWTCLCIYSKYCVNVLFQNISELYKFLFLVYTNQIKKTEQILNSAATNSKNSVCIIYLFSSEFCSSNLGVWVIHK